MKKYFTLFLFSALYLVSAKAESQVVRPEEGVPKADSIGFSEGFDSNSLILEDAMQEVEVDTNESYVQEFIRDKFRFQWGLRGSITRSQLNFANIVPIRVNANGSPTIVNGKLVRDQFGSNSKFSQQYSAGVFGRMSRGSFFVQPELVYTQKGGIFDILGRDERLINRINASVNVIDVPVLLGIKFRKARIFFGPVTSFAFSISEDFQKGLKPYATVPLDGSFLQRPVVNFMSGIGFEFDQFFFDFRYESGLSNYTDINIGPSSNPSRFRFSSNIIMFSVGIIQ
jgi:hypothetical protein